MKQVACFITPHGFGHATRMTAVLEALKQRVSNLHPHLFTTVPKSLFAETLDNFSHHPLHCDIGLVQKNGLETDLPATIKELQDFLPFNHSLVQELAEGVKGCSLVLCDIAPLGIAVAKEAGIPSILIENFTWDWIYRAYLPRHPGLQAAIDYLSTLYGQVDIHVRTAPICGPGKGSLHCGPIFRRSRTPRSAIQGRIETQGKRLVFISTGGVAVELPFVRQLSQYPDTFFLLAGQKKSGRLADNILLLARDSGFYHPDLINAADLVICKSGYSTVSECFQAGVPIVTVGRAVFPESAVLEQFCAANLGGKVLHREEFLSGNWLRRLNAFLSEPRKAPAGENGADFIAEHLYPLLS